MNRIFKGISTVITFSLAIIILINYYRIGNEKDLNSAEKYLKHILCDHGFNDVNFGSIKINFEQKNYIEPGANPEINITAPATLFLILSLFNMNRQGYIAFSFSEKFQFYPGYKKLIYIPPKNSV